MASEWINFVKAYAKKHNIKYNEALKKAGPEYRKKHKGSTEKTTKKGNVRKGAKTAGSRLAFDDTEQEKKKDAKKKKSKK